MGSWALWLAGIAIKIDVRWGDWFDGWWCQVGLDMSMKLMTQLYIELIFVWKSPQKCWKLDSFRGCLRLFL